MRKCFATVKIPLKYTHWLNCVLEQCSIFLPTELYVKAHPFLPFLTGLLGVGDGSAKDLALVFVGCFLFPFPNVCKMWFILTDENKICRTASS